MSTTLGNDTPAPAASQRPNTLAEAIGQLSSHTIYAPIETPLLSEFVHDLILSYPQLVMEKVLVRRLASITEALREYRGEV